MSKQNFILTSDEPTMQQLLNCGFTFVCKEGNKWRFINDSKLNFSDKEKQKLTYTNMYHC